MTLLNTLIHEVKGLCLKQTAAGTLRTLASEPERLWPDSGRGEIVLASDTGLELGNPQDESVSFLLWTGDRTLINDKTISLIGPDVCEAPPGRCSFGKVVMVSGDGFNEENSYQRFHEMDLLRYDLSLKGYMMRAVSQYMREWSRISHEAITAGFSFSILGNALIRQLKTLPYVDDVEILFVTSSAEDVRELKSTGDRFIHYINAMTKMETDHDVDCANCEFQAVCDEAEELRDMHQARVAGQTR